MQISFNGPKTIDQVIVYTLQDNYPNPVDPPDNLTFILYGVTAFQVQGWNGAAWVNLGAAVTGNNLVKPPVNFAAFTTNQIRVNITAALAGTRGSTEIEAWTAPGDRRRPRRRCRARSTRQGEPDVTFTATVTGSIRPARQLHQGRQLDRRLRRRGLDRFWQREDGAMHDELRCHGNLLHRCQLRRRRYQPALRRAPAVRGH